MTTFHRPFRVRRDAQPGSMDLCWAVYDNRRRVFATFQRKDPAEECAKALNAFPASERLAHASGRLAAFLAFVEAGISLDGETVDPETVIASYMGHGASDAIRVKDLRELSRALVQYAEAVKE